MRRARTPPTDESGAQRGSGEYPSAPELDDFRRPKCRWPWWVAGGVAGVLACIALPLALLSAVMPDVPDGCASRPEPVAATAEVIKAATEAHAEPIYWLGRTYADSSPMIVDDGQRVTVGYGTPSRQQSDWFDGGCTGGDFPVAVITQVPEDRPRETAYWGATELRGRVRGAKAFGGGCKGVSAITAACPPLELVTGQVHVALLGDGPLASRLAPIGVESTGAPLPRANPVKVPRFSSRARDARPNG